MILMKRSFWLSNLLASVRDSYLIQSIRGVGDQLSEENFFVGVEGVDDQTHKLSDLGLESEGFSVIRHFHGFGKCSARKSSYFLGIW